MKPLEEKISHQLGLTTPIIIQSKLGTSALGTAYKIQHPIYGICVLKIFEGRVVRQKPKYLKKFLQLANLGKDIHHPNLSTIFYVYNEDDSFILREFVSGLTLEENIQRNKSFSVIEASKIFTKIATGLASLAEMSIVHKNLKSSNLIFDLSGNIKIVDFSMPPTTPHYLAPEQCQGKPSDFRSDIYSLGILYFYSLTGQLPFQSSKPNEIMDQHINKSCPDARKLKNGIPSKAIQVIERMTAKVPQERYSNYAELVSDLERIFQQQNSDLTRAITIELPPLEEDSEAENNAPIPTIAMPGKLSPFSKSQSVNDVKPAFAIQVASTLLESEQDTLPTEIIKILEQATDITPFLFSQTMVGRRSITFPKIYEAKIVQYFYDKFHRECWMLKELENDQVEADIDFDQVLMLHYLYGFEKEIQNSLKKIRVRRGEEEKVKESEGLHDTLFLNELSKNIDQKTNIENKNNEETNQQQTAIYGKEQNSQETVLYEKGQNIPGLTPQNQETVLYEKGQDIPGLIPQNQETVLYEKGQDLSSLVEKKQETSFSQSEIEKPFLEDLTQDKVEEIYLDIVVDFNNHYQSLGWSKFVRENELQKDIHFQLLPALDGSPNKKIVRMDLSCLLDYEKQQDNISAIKHFFQSDYEIHELGKGGMGIILKLTTKNNATIISLRPENTWARQYFADVLHIRKGQDNKEIVYAEVPAKTSLVVKVAFKDYEESLIQEGKSLEELGKDSSINPWLIGMIQQGHLMAFHSSHDNYLGYYLMIEYASQGTVENLYKKFPQGRVSSLVAYTILYGLTQALLKLKQFGLIHRDIKPQNILFNDKYIAKLSDFGLAITTRDLAPGLTEDRKRLLRLLDSQFLKISRQKEQVEKKWNALKEMYQQQQNSAKSEDLKELSRKIQELELTLKDLEQQEKSRAESLKDRYRIMSAGENALKNQFAGSLYYAAPEQFETDKALTFQCDVYQLGAVMYTLLTGLRPVEGETMSELVSKVVYFPKPKVSDKVSCNGVALALSDLVAEMMCNSPNERITIEQVSQRLKDILAKFEKELRQIPEFPLPVNITLPKEVESFQKKVQFAKKMHQLSWDIIEKYCINSKDRQKKYVFVCPKCKKKLHVYKYMQGKTGHCPHCHHPIIIKIPE